jgi:hypothetical protein
VTSGCTAQDWTGLRKPRWARQKRKIAMGQNIKNIEKLYHANFNDEN